MLIAGSKAEGGVLTFYTSITNTSNAAVAAAFENAFPWTKLEIVRKGGPILAQQFYAEKAAGIERVDVINSGAAEVYPDFRKKRFLARIDNLPEYGALRPIAKGPDGSYVAFLFISEPMIWNTRLLSSDQIPDDLWAFASPTWKDKLASGNPITGGAAMNWYSWVCECRKQAPPAGRPPSNLGTKWMNAMQRNDILLPGEVGPLNNTIITGQRDLAVSQWMGSVVEAIKAGAPIDYKFPTQGTIGQSWIAGINADAAHPYTARLFLNWLLSREGQILLIELLGAHSARADLDSAKYFPLQHGLIPFDKLWILDLESITPADTKSFVDNVSVALTGKAAE